MLFLAVRFVAAVVCMRKAASGHHIAKRRRDTRGRGWHLWHWEQMCKAAKGRGKEVVAAGRVLQEVLFLL